jgi:hypothetical protein
VLVATGCAYLGERQGELIFRPTKETWWGFNGDQHSHVEHWIPVGGNGDRLHAWWLPAEAPDAPVMLYLHGARWNLSGSVTRIERWRRLGFSVLAIDYRGFGKSTDIAPTETLSYEDAEAGWDHLATLAPGKPRYVVGHSLGGAIAVELVRRRGDAAGVVLEATFTSIKDLVERSALSYLPVGLILTQHFDTLAKIPEIRSPILITHGTNDRIVPFEMGEKLYAAANGRKRFLRVEGGTHHNLSSVAFDDYRRTLREFFGDRGDRGQSPN